MLTFTCIDAIGPRVVKSSLSAIPGPSAGGSATAAFAGFLDGAALGASGSDCCWSDGHGGLGGRWDGRLSTCKC